jgi:hypothetical protein
MDLGVFVCENSEDIKNSLSFPESPVRNVFADWEVGSKRYDRWYGYDNDFKISGRPGVLSWDKNNEDKTLLIQSLNTEDFTFCVTPYETNKYDITLSVRSNKTDNDVFGIVASYVEDENGRPHILSFCRNREPSRPYFYCMYDKVDGVCLSSNLIETSSNWNIFSSGVLIRVIRDGSKISAITGDPLSSGTPELNYNSSYRIEVDLSSTDRPYLNVFNKPGKIGVHNFS